MITTMRTGTDGAGGHPALSVRWSTAAMRVFRFGAPFP